MNRPCDKPDPVDRVRYLIKLLKCASKNLCPHSVQCTEKHIEHLHHESRGTALVDND